MKTASVSQAKNGLSALLQEVKRGETVLITSRGRPIATLAPYDLAGLDDDELLADMVARGIARPPRRKLDLEWFYAGDRPVMPEGMSAADLINADREERI